jgi:hypothetical protein
MNITTTATATATAVAALQTRLRTTTRHLDRLTGEARAVAQTGRRLSTEVTALHDEADLTTRAAGILTQIGEDRQTETQQAIETLVTRGLQVIFGEELSFHLVPGVRAKTPVVDFIVRTQIADDPPVDTDVMDARGGGLVAVVGFLLRLVVLLLSRADRDQPLILDETFAHLSAEYEGRLAEFLRELVDKTGVQIIMVTHSDAYSDVADVRYRFEARTGATQIRPL